MKTENLLIRATKSKKMDQMITKGILSIFTSFNFLVVTNNFDAVAEEIDFSCEAKE